MEQNNDHARIMHKTRFCCSFENGGEYDSVKQISSNFNQGFNDVSEFLRG